MSLHVSQHATWSSVLDRVSRATLAEFAGERLRNLHEGRWQDSGEPGPVVTAEPPRPPSPNCPTLHGSAPASSAASSAPSSQQSAKLALSGWPMT